MKRGDIVTVALPGAYGKPRPALVVQSDLLDEHPSITVLPITTHLIDASYLRIAVGTENGLYQPSQIQIDKAHTMPRDKIGPVIGRVDAATLTAVGRSLAVFFGLA